jgi:small subunit ribosomal protein S21
MLVEVRNNNVTAAYRQLMKSLNKDGLFRELRDRESYTPPSKKRLLKHKIAVGRKRKEARKKAELFDNIESRLVYRSKYTNKRK